MSRNNVTEPEVLTGHTDVICSTSIERIVTGRNAALTRIESLIRELDDISILTRDIGGGTAQEWGMREGHRYDCWFTEKPDKAMKAIIRNIDRRIWCDLMNKSGMQSLMDAQARDEWHKSLEKDDIPAISEDNILSTFEQLHKSKGEVFERGVINVFKGLSWDYKTNNPCYFGKKIIVNNLVKYDKWGYSLSWGLRRDQLADLERMLFLLDGKTIPDNRHDVTIRLMDFIRDNPRQQVFGDDLFTIRFFQKGSGHITFKRMDLVEKMNDIIANHYPGMLAAK
ncbi:MULTISPECIES: DUF4942 domain-containing protein [Klebsiella/Raoultella group]|uniref:DUF4942 domain-containing protein n=2 Tax=Klebsiella TaxID=570 RepID=A0ABT5CYU1_9ENTR|nr:MULTISPECIES: DUF4942 domain-containing protein [Klebsiella/Raoultella group]EKP1134177.1 DUF4942 domain-containing protein [Klebsiella michiganensis]HCD1392396.1 DUF4942 domain-containing protein [Klebsiella pneumoniae subsp. pneumoniae]EJG2380271.1 DUF4942 domain-containing protein [Raoultella ornithinolytica]MCE9803984.1 DUF4942 domain-containing protein [Raoultella ornithinolytica]MCE9813631.1 DUF4942 domain-containing protein [Raoultella ornithinolytica]